ncbi:MAG TPA: pitrilysin family protein [Bacteroidia bacterium]|nr:pitrilysin family protein [Bacteroidia bacterium]
MLNRKQAPQFKTIDSIAIQHAQSFKLDNGIHVYTIDAGSQDLTRIEFIFKAGMYYQDAPLVAAAAGALIENGTAKYSANQISDSIDFYGSFFETSVHQDYSSLALFSLNKHLESTLVFVEELIKNANYPQEEIDTYLINKKQKFLVNSQKVDVLARRIYSELLFGKTHPYGLEVKTEDHDNTKRNSIVDFYKTHYTYSNCIIIVSGKLPDNLAQVLNAHFGKEKWGTASNIEKAYTPVQTTTQNIHYVEKPDAVQSAIRMGRKLFNKTHPDYFNFQVLNTIFGGYFGSRLMANIREDKGYTYGIGSGLSSLVHDGYFFISTEVGSDVTKNALKEVYKEIDIMQNDLVPADELETVKNYILGQFLRSVEGPFALADKFRGVWEFGLDYSYYDNYFNAVKSVTSQQIRDLAGKYLQKTDIIELVVGKK